MRVSYVMQLALHTVLRHLHEHPHEQALWLDTTASFSAERGNQILQSIVTSAKATNPPPDDHSEPAQAADQAPNALDRLIVAKVFDLQSAIQAIQQLRKHGPVIYDDRKRENSKTPVKLPFSDVDMATDSDATIYSYEVPETGNPAMALLSSSAEPSDQVNKDEDAENNPKEFTSADKGTDTNSMIPHLRIIVIDSISALLMGVLNATSAEGHARMLSFMRLLLWSLTTQTIVPARKTTIFVINNFVSLASTANSTAALHSVFPALNAKKYKAALGPTFTYLTDWTVYLSHVSDVFPQYGMGEGPEAEETKKRLIFEIVRSRRMVSRGLAENVMKA